MVGLSLWLGICGGSCATIHWLWARIQARIEAAAALDLNIKEARYTLAQLETDTWGIVQPTQDIRFAEQKFPGMRCRAIAAQFLEDAVIALFELTLQDSEIKVVEERHYRLVPADQLDAESIRKYRP